MAFPTAAPSMMARSHCALPSSASIVAPLQPSRAQARRIKQLFVASAATFEGARTTGAQDHLLPRMTLPRAGDDFANANGAAVARDDRAPPAGLAAQKVFHKADAVCFDVDCTITVNDTLDLLAEFMGVGEEVAELTHKAMDGTMDLEESLEERLKIINCTPSDIKSFLDAHPPETRLTPGIVSLVKNLHKHGVDVYLVTGGFREMALPIAEYLGVPKERVFANRMLWHCDDETMEPTRLVGFDASEPTARNQGKPQAIAMIRQQNPYDLVVMIGDGITDLEAVQVSGGADLFIGYGGVVEREAVVAGADWFVNDWADLEKALKRFQVAMSRPSAWGALKMSSRGPQ